MDKEERKMKYYKTAKNNSTVGYWELCTAETVTGAKREATRDCGAYMDDVVCIGISEFDCPDSPIKTVSEKHNGRWIDMD
jgi:hypothetical protein